LPDYLAACVFLADMVKENPLGIGAAGTGLTDGDQLVLRRAASQPLT
jgi:hypothetical protein